MTMNENPEAFMLVQQEQQTDDAQHCISTLSYSEASGLLAAVRGPDASVAIFDIRQQNPNPQRTLATWKAHAHMLNYCRFLKSDDKQQLLLATASEEGILKIWDVSAIIANQQKLQEQQDQTEPATFGLVSALNARNDINCFAQSTDGSRIYCGCEDGHVVVFNSNQQGGEPADRFMVSEESVNDVAVAPTPYGDLVFTGADDGSLRCWRTAPGQRAPKESAAPTADQIQQKLKVENAEDQQQQQQEKDGDDDEEEGGDGSNNAMRQMIVESLGDEACNRLLTSFDALQGKDAINHIMVSDLSSGQPHIFLSCGQMVFSVAFDVDAGELSEMPSLLYQGHDDYVRGMHAVGRGAFMTVADDGAVALFSRAPNLATPVAPLRRFTAENCNIMSSVFVPAPPAADGSNDEKPMSVLVTGALNGNVKLWRLKW